MQGREHHFVPQFYLRGFSSDGHSVTCFNLARNKCIAHAGIKHQCSKRNFHSFLPGLEALLGELEGRASTVLGGIRRTQTIPPIGSQERLWLVTFVVFQKMRTTRAARMSDAMSEHLRELMPNVESDRVPAIAIPLSLANNMVPAAADLSIHLFRNDTSAEFVTSDAPVIIHNQYCEGIDYRGVNGWNCRGLQVFFPISPRELLLMFDPAIYKVGAAHKGSHVTNLLRAEEIDQFNAFQILNAEHNVYFKNGDASFRAASQCQRLLSVRPKGRWKFVETESMPKSDGGTGAILHSFEPLLPIRLRVEAISIRKKARQAPLAQRGTAPRQATGRLQKGAQRELGDGYVRYPVKAITTK